MAEPLGRNLGPAAIYKVNLPKPTKSTIRTTRLPAVKKPTLSAGSFHNAPKQGAGSSTNTPSIFGSSQIGLSGSSVNPFANIKYPKPLTAEQQLQKNYEQTHPQHSSGGVMGLISSGGFGFEHLLGEGLSLLSRSAHAVSGAEHEQNAFAKSHPGDIANSARGLGSFLSPGSWGAALHGFEQGIQGKTHYTQSDVLKQQGFLNGHGDIRSAVGLGQDIAVDPLNLVGGVGVLGKDARIIKGLQELDKPGNEALIRKLAPMNGPAYLDHVRTVAEKGLKDLAVRTDKQELEMMSDTSRKVALERLANEEARSNVPKYLGIRIGPSKGFSVTVRTPLKIGKTLAEKEAGLEAGKLGMRIKSTLATRLHPAYMNPIGHAAENTVRHTSERLTGQTWKYAIAKLGEFAHGELSMSAKEQQAALVAAETKGTVKDGQIVGSALEEALAKRGITGEAASKASKFIHAWHDVTTHLMELDRRHGVEYAKGAVNDRVYIPHIFEKGTGDAKILFSKSNLSKLGYETHGQRLTYEKQLEIAARASKGGKKIIQDPIELLAHRVAAGGKAGAHGILRQILRDTVAQPTRIRDIGRYNKAYSKLRKLQASKSALEDVISRHPGQQTYKRLMAGQSRAKFQRSLDHAVAENDQKIAGLKDQIKKVKKGKGNPRKASLTASLNAAMRDKGRLQQIVDSAPHETAYTEAINRHGIEGARTLTEAKTNLDRIGKAITQEEPRAAAKMWRKNPEALQAGWKRVEALSHMGPDGKPIHYHVPAEVHAGIANIEKAMIDPKEMDGITRAFSKAMAIWKLSVTSVNPGYRIRNTLSDLWNMYIAGVPASAIPFYAAKASRVLKLNHDGEEKLAKGIALSKKEKDAVELIREANDHGVLSGLFMGDVGKAVNRVRQGSTGPFDATVGRYARVMTHANATAENAGRLTHYLYRLDHGHSVYSAAEEVKAAHFDYEDLSRFEQTKMKAIAPFYTWTRKNVPYQVKAILTHPGKVASYGKVANTSEQVSGAKPTDIIGHALDYHPLAFRAGKGFVDPQIGLSDLYNITHPSQELQNLNPLAQDAYTALTGRNFQTGQPLEGPDAAHQAAPAPGWLSGLLTPFGLGERTQRMVNGVEQPGPGVNPWVAQVAQQLPLGSYLLSRNPVDEARKGSTPIPGIDPRTLSYGFGLSYTNVDKKNELAIAAMEDDAARKAYIKHMRDQGLFAPSDWSPGHSWWDNYLAKMNKRHTQRG